MGFLSVRQHPSAWNCSRRRIERRTGPGPSSEPFQVLTPTFRNSLLSPQPSTWTKAEFSS